MISHIAIDLETTGFSHNKNDVIQLAAVEIDNNGWKTGRHYSCYMKPHRPQYWSEEAEKKVHKIPLERAMTFPSRREGLIGFLNWLVPLKEEFPLGFVYHGRGYFDYRFLKAAFLNEVLHESFEKVFREYFVESTDSLAKEYLSLENYQLSTVCENLKIPLNHHEALSDAYACANVFCFLQKNYVEFKRDLFQ